MALSLRQMQRHSSLNVKARARRREVYECHTVFQSTIAHRIDASPITLQDVDDHLAAVKRLKDCDKEDYFSAHGMDYKRCYEYVNIVKYMNRCYNKRAKTGTIQWLHLTILTAAIAFICNYIQEDL